MLCLGHITKFTCSFLTAGLILSLTIGDVTLRKEIAFLKGACADFSVYR